MDKNILFIVVPIVFIGAWATWAALKIQLKASKEKRESKSREFYEKTGTEHYDVEVSRASGHATTNIEDFDYVELIHPIFEREFLYAMIPEFESLPFVDSAYIASNNLVRLNLASKKPYDYGEDIALNSGKGKVFVIRNFDKQYHPLEDEVISLIEKKASEVVKKLEPSAFAG